jgi:hypothetical protein
MIDLNFYYPILIAPYKSWPDKTLAGGSHYIFTCMSGNTYFSALATQVADYGELSGLFRNQVAIAANRGKNAVIAKDMTRLELIAATLTLRNAVAQIAKGDLQALASSGMVLRKKWQRVALTAPQNLRITSGAAEGQLKIKVKTVHGARSYEIKYTIDPQTPASQWASVTCTTSQYRIDGLQSGAKYWIMVGAVGGKGQTTWSVSQLSPYVP